MSKQKDNPLVVLRIDYTDYLLNLDAASQILAAFATQKVQKIIAGWEPETKTSVYTLKDVDLSELVRIEPLSPERYAILKLTTAAREEHK